MYNPYISCRLFLFRDFIYSGNENNRDSNIKTLRVAEANSRDVGRRVGRVDPKVASEIGLSTGDAVVNI
jgi:hypothetical protein